MRPRPTPARSGIDGSPSHLDLDGPLATRGHAGATLSIDSDSHRTDVLHRQMETRLILARRGWVEPEDVINTRSLNEVRAFIGAKRRAVNGDQKDARGAVVAVLAFALCDATLLPGVDFGDTPSFQVMARPDLAARRVSLSSPSATRSSGCAAATGARAQPRLAVEAASRAADRDCRRGALESLVAAVAAGAPLRRLITFWSQAVSPRSTRSHPARLPDARRDPRVAATADGSRRSRVLRSTRSASAITSR